MVINRNYLLCRNNLCMNAILCHNLQVISITTVVFILLCPAINASSQAVSEGHTGYKAVNVDDPQEGAARISKAREYLLSPLNEDFDKASYLLRKVVADEQEMELMEAFFMLGLMHEALSNQYLERMGGSRQYDPRHSVGLVYISEGLTEPGFSLLIGEASLLHMEAQLALIYIYKNGFGDIPQYDRRILDFYKQTSSEGIQRSKLYYGEILLYGLGVSADFEKGGELLKASELEEATPLLQSFSNKVRG